jgi:hypothetical protein
MTVVATALAGLSSSEMTRAQYARSMAAQLQSKAADQWGFFQAKRLRGSMQRSTLDLLQATNEIKPLDPAALEKAGANDVAVVALTQAKVPDAGPAPEMDADLTAALHAMDAGDEMPPAFWKLPDAKLEEALQGAKDRVRSLDEATEPVNRAVDRLEPVIGTKDFIAARLRYTAARYDAEARLNQAVAHVLELQVRKSNFKAERHHRRSLRFFVGMLAAQAAVIIATFSLAAQKRSWLWSVAATAGILAILFAVWVYLFV